MTDVKKEDSIKDEGEEEEKKEEKLVDATKNLNV